MWVEKYKSKKGIRYRFLERYTDPLSGKKRKISVSYTKNNVRTKKQAQLELDQLISDIKQKKTSAINSTITLEQLAKEFLKIYQKRVAQNTYYNAYHGLKNICKDLGFDTLANNITTEMLNRYLDKKLYNPSHPLTNAAIQNTKKYLSMLFKFGVKYGLVAKNPVADVDVTWKSEVKRKRDRIENKYLTDYEYKLILKDCDNQNRDDIKYFLEWLYLTGMRCGEAAALYPSNIIEDDDGFKAVINGTVGYQRVTPGSNQKGTFKKTAGAKTIAGNREVILPSKAVKIYQKAKIGKAPNDFLFVNKDSRSHRPFNATHLDRYLHRIEKRQGIKKNLTTHIFRHTHVSKLAELGVPLYVIKRRVGHENSKITENIYLHVTKKQEKSLTRKLEDL